MRRSRGIIIACAAAIGLGATAISAVPPARAAIMDAMSCALSSPCLEWDNTGSGDAIKGVSTKGNALHGQTKFKSAGKTAGKAGVFGEDLSTSGNLDSGVSGVSTSGAGVTGTSTAYNGVQGFSSSGGSGVYGQSSSASGFGVAGRNTSSTHDNNGAGVLADGNTAADGLHAFAYGSSANAIYAFSQSASALVLNQGPNDTADELRLQGNTTAHALIHAADSNGNDIFDVKNDHTMFLEGNTNLIGASGTAAVVANELNDASVTLRVESGTYNTDTDVLEVDGSGTKQMSVTDTGNIIISGEIYTHGSCAFGCVVGNRQVHRVTEYSALEAEPTIEDNGEASLVNGRADVALDQKFANVIDTTSAYLVSVTPEGDCRGLYIANRTPRGFTVRELQGGHADIAFVYRIVAKRFGETDARLPMVDVHPAASLKLPSRLRNGVP